jgi:hypothetical protein
MSNKMKILLIGIILFQASFFLIHIYNERNDQMNTVPMIGKNTKLSIIFGKLQTETFYGPPGYGEDPENDKKLNQYMLYLEEEPLGEMAKMQLVYSGNEDLSKFKNKQVKVTGTFFSSHTGYHNTAILIESKNIELVQ